MDTLTLIIVAVVKIAVFVFVLMTADAYMVLFERKVVGRMQNRWGPTRVGPFGLLQPLADGIKFILKEDLTPPHVHKSLFILAPFLSVVLALVSISIIPFGNTISIAGQTTSLQITGALTSSGRIGYIYIALLMLLIVTLILLYGLVL